MPARHSSNHGKAPRRNGVESGNAETRSSSAADNGVPDEVEAEDVPMNRAQRRAKGKAGSQPRPIGKIVPARTNVTHGPRSYANRRSG